MQQALSDNRGHSNLCTLQRLDFHRQDMLRRQGNGRLCYPKNRPIHERCLSADRNQQYP